MVLKIKVLCSHRAHWKSIMYILSVRHVNEAPLNCYKNTFSAPLRTQRPVFERTWCRWMASRAGTLICVTSKTTWRLTMQISRCIPVASVCHKSPHLQIVLSKNMQMQQSALLSHRGHTALMRSSILQGNVLRHLLRTDQSHCTGRSYCRHTVLAARAGDQPGEPNKYIDLQYSCGWLQAYMPFSMNVDTIVPRLFGDQSAGWPEVYQKGTAGACACWSVGHPCKLTASCNVLFRSKTY